MSVPLPSKQEYWPRWGRVTLKPFSHGLTSQEWRWFWESFRDPEIAKWNGNRPLKMPLWLFKRIVAGEVRRGDRVGFAILDEEGEWLGTLELYETDRNEATLGIIIGRKDRWGQGYGREAVAAAVEYAFARLGVDRVKLRTFGHNERALKAFAAAGFREVGREDLPDGRKDVLMEVTKQDWRRGRFS